MVVLRWQADERQALAKSLPLRVFIVLSLDSESLFLSPGKLPRVSSPCLYISSINVLLVLVIEFSCFKYLNDGYY